MCACAVSVIEMSLVAALVGVRTRRRGAACHRRASSVSSGVVSSMPVSNGRAVDDVRAHVFACCTLEARQVVACVAKARARRSVVGDEWQLAVAC